VAVEFRVLRVEGPPDGYRYQVAHRALPKLLFSMTEGLFDLMGGRPVDGVTWDNIEELVQMDAHLRSGQAIDASYTFAPAHVLDVEGWEAYWLQLPDPSGTTEAVGVIAARRPDLPLVPRVFVVEPSQGEPVLAEWRYDGRIRYRPFEASEEGLVAFLSQILADSAHPPPRMGAPLLRMQPAPDPSWWSSQPPPDGAGAPSEPTPASAAAPDRASQLLAEGVALIRADQASAAIEKLEHSLAIRLDPTAVKLLIAAHLKLGNREEAVSVAQTYRAEAPPDDDFADLDYKPSGAGDTLSAIGASLVMIAFGAFFGLLSYGYLFTDSSGYTPRTTRGRIGQALLDMIGGEIPGVVCGLVALGFVMIGLVGMIQAIIPDKKPGT